MVDATTGAAVLDDNDDDDDAAAAVPSDALASALALNKLLGDRNEDLAQELDATRKEVTSLAIFKKRLCCLPNILFLLFY